MIRIITIITLVLFLYPSTLYAAPHVDTGQSFYADELMKNPPRYLSALAARAIAARTFSELSEISARAMILKFKIAEKIPMPAGTQHFAVIKEGLDAIIDITSDMAVLIQKPVVPPWLEINFASQLRAIENADDALASAGLVILENGDTIKQVTVILIPSRPVGPLRFSHRQLPDLQQSWVRYQKRFGDIGNDSVAAAEARAQKDTTLPIVDPSLYAPSKSQPENPFPPAEYKYITAVFDFIYTRVLLLPMRNLAEATKTYNALEICNEEFLKVECPPRFKEIHPRLAQIFKRETHIAHLTEQGYLTRQWQPFNDAVAEVQQSNNKMSDLLAVVSGLLSQEEWDYLNENRPQRLRRPTPSEMKLAATATAETDPLPKKTSMEPIPVPTPTPTPTTPKDIRTQETDFMMGVFDFLSVLDNIQKSGDMAHMATGFDTLRHYTDAFKALECPPRFKSVHEQLLRAFEAQTTVAFEAGRQQVVGSNPKYLQAIMETRKPENNYRLATKNLAELMTRREWEVFRTYWYKRPRPKQ